MTEAYPSHESKPKVASRISRAISGKYSAGLASFLTEVGVASGTGATFGAGLGFFVGQPALGAVIGGIGGALVGLSAHFLRYRDP